MNLYLIKTHRGGKGGHLSMEGHRVSIRNRATTHRSAVMPFAAAVCTAADSSPAGRQRWRNKTGGNC
ncbi:hypothetical protein E2C01_065775 [Portunus trituberculatus]|uniref:Uncharacterized protein n=1 Tax=Portunus trituberculatus TaxID=210409 RepID=A0A5B7HQI9_PORTR|nr:hypothetical protein [Portunus trituberculatus]